MSNQQECLFCFVTANVGPSSSSVSLFCPIKESAGRVSPHYLKFVCVCMKLFVCLYIFVFTAHKSGTPPLADFQSNQHFFIYKKLLQFPHNFLAISSQFPRKFLTQSSQIPRKFLANSLQFPCNFFANSPQNPWKFLANSPQFSHNLISTQYPRKFVKL